MHIKALALAAAALPALLMAAGPAAAQEEMMQNGIQYACTGVGLEEREDLRWTTYPLRLEATHRGGGYLSDIHWTIVDKSGATVFEVRCEFAPWLVVRLEPGSYKVTATALGTHIRDARVAVSRARQTRVVLRFNEVTEQ